jgi:hypothetical protein
MAILDNEHAKKLLTAHNIETNIANINKYNVEQKQDLLLKMIEILDDKILLPHNNTRTPFNTIYHEMGHLQDTIYRVSPADLFESAKEYPKLLKEWLSNNKNLCTASKVSGYATTGPGEFIAETFAGLTGIGDLIVTCDSMHSRNRRAGILIGQGKTMKEAVDEVQQVVEGIYSAKAALALARKYQIQMPIVEQVNEVLFEDKKALDAFNDLMNRERKDEV